MHIHSQIFDLIFVRQRNAICVYIRKGFFVECKSYTDVFTFVNIYAPFAKLSSGVSSGRIVSLTLAAVSDLIIG